VTSSSSLSLPAAVAATKSVDEDDDDDDDDTRCSRPDSTTARRHGLHSRSIDWLVGWLIE